MIEDSLGKVIRRRRLAKGLTQADLSRLVGIVQSHVSAVESATKPPTMKTLERICSALEVRVSELIAEAETDCRSMTRG